MLVAEDDALIALDLALALEGAGAEKVVIVESVGQALEEMGRQQFILAVLDIQLTDGSGLRVASRCLEQRIPFVITTGFSELARDAQFSPFILLPKPFSHHDVERAVASAIAIADRLPRKEDEEPDG